MLAINLLGYMQKPDNNPTVVDIFCSCGGLSEGFHQGGYNVLLGIDCDRWSIRTYNRYHQERGRLKNVDDIDASPQADLIVVLSHCPLLYRVNLVTDLLPQSFI